MIPIEVEEPRDVQIFDRPQEDVEPADDASDAAGAEEAESSEEAPAPEPAAPDADQLRAQLSLSEDFRSDFVHGEKGPEHQKYIVLHDTEGDSNASSVIDWWDSNGNYVAAHFVVNKDGTIVQCAPLDTIVHHAGYGDTGHNELYGVEDESRDDMRGTQPIGDWAADYGMNSYSIGIEMVHVGGSGDYPQAQLEALDGLIAYIDAYYGFESEIIDHKAWRTGNSDTSPEFTDYLASYQQSRVHG
ncbi:peptidoglycan recognition family protein [Adlercreutzia sp. R7]|uniref:N-acetylmuramoyl-L-alanine amidase n=1 Tax=Adlercreutzia wanghongyangiae TaxID=3111451 RepID=A0ABU6IGU2_9ACTN|nr:peptidoglycan recognition family protein [Adlercreutzia sp. R7]